MEQEQVMLATAGALDWNSPPAASVSDSDLTRTPGDSMDGDDHRRQLKRAVAELTCSAIARMRRRELVFAIRTARLPWLDGADRRLADADRPTLERLAFLARRVCRRQLFITDWTDRSSGSPQPADVSGAHRRPGTRTAADRVVLHSLHREKAR